MSNNFFFIKRIWSIGPSMTTSRTGFSGTGSILATMICGGWTNTWGGSNTNTTELFDGTTWSSSGNMVRNEHVHNCCGSQDAATCITGLAQVYSYAFDGSAWSSTANSNRVSNYSQIFGSQNDCVKSGNNTAGIKNTAESFNGTAWSNISDMTEDKLAAASFGSSTNGIVAGGGSTTFGTNCQKYDGSTWSNTSGSLIISNFNNSHSVGSSGSFGMQCCGASALSPFTLHKRAFQYDDISWYSISSLNGIIRRGHAYGGIDPNNCLVVGGDNESTPTTATEIYS